VESSLINRLKNKEESAFRILVEKYQHRVFNTCLGFLRNADDADDIAQEVFIEVYRSIDKFNEQSSLATWLYRISVNKSLDYIKMQNRKKRWSLMNRIATDSNSNDSLFAHYETPEISLEQKERIAALNKAIDNLPKNQKTAFTLHKYEQLPYSEIADILSTTVSAVESLMHRAKKNLTKQLELVYKKEII